VIKACLSHSRGCISGNSSAKIPELTTSWCWILRTVRINSFVDHGGFPLRAARNSLHSSLWVPALHYTVNSPPIALIWIHSHTTACCFLFFLLPVLRTIFKCACWVICLVAALAASRWTNLCLCSGCAPRIWGIWCSARQSASIRSAPTSRRWFCIHDVLVWNRTERW